MTYSKGTTLDGLSGQYFSSLFYLFLFGPVVAMCDQVYDVEAMFILP